MSTPRANCLTFAGADRIAQSIADYWLAKGFEPRMMITSTRVMERGVDTAIYMVRSNMVGGMPVRKAE